MLTTDKLKELICLGIGYGMDPPDKVEESYARLMKRVRAAEASSGKREFVSSDIEKAEGHLAMPTG